MTETSIRTDSGSDPNRISEADIQNGLPHTYGRTDVELGQVGDESNLCNARAHTPESLDLAESHTGAEPRPSGLRHGRDNASKGTRLSCDTCGKEMRRDSLRRHAKEVHG